LTGY